MLDVVWPERYCAAPKGKRATARVDGNNEGNELARELKSVSKVCCHCVRSCASGAGVACLSDSARERMIVMKAIPGYREAM